MKNVILFALAASWLFGYGCKSNEKVDVSKNQEVKEKIDPNIKQNAIESAEKWLSLIDTEKFEESWIEGSELFKNSIAKENWISAVRNARSTFGKYIKREMLSATYTKTLPGAPDGEYLVIQFEAQFEKNGKAVETITPMKDTDGEWRVSGYFIK